MLNRLKAIFYAFLSILISISAYLVPMLVAFLSTMVDGDFEVDAPPEERAELVTRERRTMYVAMTRAMRALLVVRPAGASSPAR